jgi:selenocysteine-specific elongation factor
VRDGAAAHAGELWFGRAAFDDLGARVLAHLAKSGRLTIADFKALTGLGRRQAIPLLELLDREGVTKREGDDRVAGK